MTGRGFAVAFDWMVYLFCVLLGGRLSFCSAEPSDFCSWRCRKFGDLEKKPAHVVMPSLPKPKNAANRQE